MLIDRAFYKKSLTDLWRSVFEDEECYIDLIFSEKYDGSILCFAKKDSEETVSAFYLLKTFLNYNGKRYTGFYLYAAATDNSYRGKGLMSELIKEAQTYCENEGFDFISLVPSEKSLYSYYGRFGFFESSYGVKKNLISSEALKEISAEEYYKRRRGLKINYFNYDEKAFEYSAECLKAGGYRFFSYNNSIIIKNSDGEIIENIDIIDEDFSKLEKYPFGMIYPINDELKTDWKNTDIYMNIALD